MVRSIFIKIILGGLLGSMLFLQTACIEEPIELDKKARTLVDTLYLRQTKILRVELDSICDHAFDQRVKVAVDSILKLRLKEIDEIINRK